jgi:hypothetical protein
MATYFAIGCHSPSQKMLPQPISMLAVKKEACTNNHINGVINANT